MQSWATMEIQDMPLDSRMGGTTHLWIHDNEFVWRSLLLVLGLMLICRDAEKCTLSTSRPQSLLASKFCIIRDFPQRLGPKVFRKGHSKTEAEACRKCMENLVTKKHRGAQFYMLSRFFHVFSTMALTVDLWQSPSKCSL